MIIPIGGGKGGTGKSCLTVNLGLALAQRREKTLIADLDLGGSNLHALIGQKNRPAGVGRMLIDNRLRVTDLIHDTPWPDLSYLPGDNHVPRTANLHASQKRKLIRGLAALDHRVVLCDLGAGASLNTIDFFLQVSRGVVVFTPELTSLINAYGFLRNAAYRALSRLVAGNLYAEEVLAEYRAAPHEDKTWIAQRVATELDRRAPDRAEGVKAFFRNWRPGLVMNRVRTTGELADLARLADLVADRLNIRPVVLGALPHDPLVRESVNRRRPVVAERPDAPFARAVNDLAARLTHWPDLTPADLKTTAQSWGLEDKAPVAAPDADLARVLAEMLPVVDDLMRAVDAARQAGQNDLAEGLKLILSGHLRRLADLGLRPIKSVGLPADPRWHEVVGTEPRAGVEPGLIVAEVAKGFAQGERLFRAAKVIVAS